MIIASIDAEHGTLEYVNAGHNPGYVIVDGRIEMLRSHGLPIGILGQTRYTAHTRPFPAGSYAILYSDGITEAENIADEEFENERLEALLEQHAASTAEQMRDALANAVDTFVGEAPQKDDETIVILRRV